MEPPCAAWTGRRPATLCPDRAARLLAGEAEFGWQAERGITSLFMHHVRDHGISRAARGASRPSAAGPTFLTVDIDVLDPAYIPGGTGTPKPGGIDLVRALWAARAVAGGLDFLTARTRWR